MLKPREDIRNIAIIAHVDHGKTTLVDGMLRQTNVFRSNETVTERILDSNALERERGITILAKNTSIVYNGYTINLVDTPGHADFGGEVERIVNMVDGVLLLVDAVEGPMPQTRFVLRQALETGCKVVVVVNKIDRPSARPDHVVNSTFDLFIDLGASDEQADFPVVFTRGLEGVAGYTPNELAPDLRPLFDTIIEHLPPPLVDQEGSTQLLVTTLEYSSYLGKIGIGRLTSGKIRGGQPIAHLMANGESKAAKVSHVFTYRDLQRQEQTEVQAGDIVAVAGIDDVGIGDTLADPEDPRPLPPIKIEEPTVRMTFGVNNSPFAGKDGKYLTSRQIRARLMRELESNVAMRVEETGKAGEFIVAGRGELHLAILIETMRREGYEFSVSRPEVIFKESDQGRLEPIEQLFLEVHNDYFGAISELLGKRRAFMQDIRYGDDGTVYTEYLVPTRGLLGLRQSLLTATRGTVIFHTLFHAFEPYKGDIDTQTHGSMVSMENGPVSAYALTGLEARGVFFVIPGEEIYSGQVVGQYTRNEDLVVNACRTKVLSAVRTGPSAIVEALSTPRIMSLDESIEYLGEDELLEVTPTALRIRKKELKHDVRAKLAKKAKKQK